MSPEQQREALAEAFPKTIGLSSSGCWMWCDLMSRWHACHENDPLQDLNAMRRLLEEFDLLVRLPIGQHMLAAVRRHQCVEGAAIVDTISATAPDWAEAYIRISNRWTDEQP